MTTRTDDLAYFRVKVDNILLWEGEAWGSDHALSKASADAPQVFIGMGYWDDLTEAQVEHVEALLTGARVEVSHNEFTVNGKQAYFVTVYEAGRSYGGPEEGGWWFDTGVPIRHEIVGSYDEAVETREKLRAEYQNTGKRYSVLGGEDYEIMIGLEPGKAYPETYPHYE